MAILPWRPPTAAAPNTDLTAAATLLKVWPRARRWGRTGPDANEYPRPGHSRRWAHRAKRDVPFLWARGGADAGRWRPGRARGRETRERGTSGSQPTESPAPAVALWDRSPDREPDFVLPPTRAVAVTISDYMA